MSEMMISAMITKISAAKARVRLENNQSPNLWLTAGAMATESCGAFINKQAQSAWKKPRLLRRRGCAFTCRRHIPVFRNYP